MKFRKDINGLRAFAVIGVLLFHFNASWMPGGFAGVDVFFVISGFLMTGIIFRGIEQEKFSILNFYVARANRIIPALALLCLILLVFGWFYLTPLEYKALGKHAASSIGFVSNIIYWTEAGYFDAASHEKWLLHTWTLSVEWQFYIIYPLILVAMRKFLSIKTMKLTILVATVLAFIFCVYSTYKWPNASYFLLSARAWEMLIGGVAYLYPFTLQEKKKKFVEVIGLALVIGSYFLISAENAWPGYLALFPVVGSFLIIQAQRNDSIITNNIVFQKIGTWSYSIYLWHWPIVVIIYTFALPEYYVYLGLVMSIFLGFLSYKYVEKIDFPRSFPTTLSYLKCKPIYIAGIIGVLGSLAFLKPGAFTSYRFSTDAIPIVMEQQKINLNQLACSKAKDGIYPGCSYGTGPVKAIVIGDSHALSQNSAIGNRAAIIGGSILSFSMNGCPTIKDIYKADHNGKKIDDSCSKLVSSAIKSAVDEYPNVPVIIINRTSMYIHGKNEEEKFELLPPVYFVDKVYSSRNEDYKKTISSHMSGTICEISQNNPVYIMKPTPEMEDKVIVSMFRLLKTGSSERSIKLGIDKYYLRQNIAFQMQDEVINRCGAKLLDPTPYLCDSEYCYGDVDGIPLYSDNNHLSSYGSELISPIYDEVFK